MTINCLVQAKLPRAGLGNMLLVWARAYIFANINSLPMEKPNWGHIYIGPWLRRERAKRYYGMYFRSKNYQSKLSSLTKKIFSSPVVHENPLLECVDFSGESFSRHRYYIFSFDTMPPWNDYFEGIKEHHAQIKERLFDDIHPSLLYRFMQRPSPEIAIHIRRGDYQAPQPGDDFAVRRFVYTPLEWYVDMLTAVREIVGSSIPATIFSDGYSNELESLLKLPNVSLSHETCAFSDMITMSRCKLLIGSAHSSFSAWASYLGQCPTLWTSTRAHLYKPIFTDETRKYIYEGGFDPANECMPNLLKENINILFENDSLSRKL